MRDDAPFMGQLAGEGPCPIYRHYHSLPFESTDITSRIEIRNQFSAGTPRRKCLRVQLALLECTTL